MEKDIDKARLYDVVVVGGGPAGLTAAIYLARARYRVVVIEKDRFGGQITITEQVVNYPGIPHTSGVELTDGMRQQAESFGAEFMLASVERLDLDGDIKTVHTNRGDFYAFGILLATGAHPRTIGFKGEAEFKGRGVAYCATCDGEFFTGKDVFVIGGGFAAAEESVFLTKFARRVTILIREDDFTCAKATADQARNHEKITVLTGVSVEEVSGSDGLDYIRWKNLKTGGTEEFRAAVGEQFGVFVFAGYTPATELTKNLAELTPEGYIVTDGAKKTTVDGLYAAGDVCVKPLRQVVTAVGDGALAATELEKYAAAMQTKTGVRPERRPAAIQSGFAERGADPSGTAAGGNAAGGRVGAGANGGLFDQAMLNQLDAVFARMENPLVLRLYLDATPLSSELKEYMESLASLTDKLSVEEASPQESAAEENPPCVRVCRADGRYTGLAFYGVPGGHEFTSFVLGLYNASGTGQSVDEKTAEEIRSISAPLELKALVSLSCTMCPELVTSAQKIASMNGNVTAEVYDLNHFPALRDRYKVMSVPCLVVNGENVTFGKKNIAQLLDYVKSVQN